MSAVRIVVEDLRTGQQWEWQLLRTPGRVVAEAIKKRIEDMQTLEGSPSAEEIGP